MAPNTAGGLPESIKDGLPSRDVMGSQDSQGQGVLSSVGTAGAQAAMMAATTGF